MNQIKKTTAALAAVIMCFGLLTGCGTATSAGTSSGIASAASQPAQSQNQTTGATTFVDALGNQVTVTSTNRVVSLYGSYAETWTLAGGTLVGATDDAIEERNMQLGDDVAIIGSVKNPSMEEIIATNPDFVILNADNEQQVDLHEALTEAGIPHAYYRVDTFEEYLDMLKQFCQFTGREDLYQKNGLDVKQQIDKVKQLVQGKTGPSVLLMRAYSTGVTAKGADNLAGYILKDLGADNIADRDDSLLENISMEEIIADDPDYIFVTTMGSEQKALDYLAGSLQANPAWAELSAVKNNHYVVLPKELFHYKPNARWGESYAYLAKILYPDLAAQIG